MKKWKKPGGKNGQEFFYFFKRNSSEKGWKWEQVDSERSSDYCDVSKKYKEVSILDKGQPL